MKTKKNLIPAIKFDSISKDEVHFQKIIGGKYPLEVKFRNRSIPIDSYSPSLLLMTNTAHTMCYHIFTIQEYDQEGNYTAHFLPFVLDRRWKLVNHVNSPLSHYIFHLSLNKQFGGLDSFTAALYDRLILLYLVEIYSEVGELSRKKENFEIPINLQQRWLAALSVIYPSGWSTVMSWAGYALKNELTFDNVAYQIMMSHISFDSVPLSDIANYKGLSLKSMDEMMGQLSDKISGVLQQRNVKIVK